MANVKSTTRVDKLFAEQFEPADDGNFVYRRNRSGPAVKVWPHERDQFLNDFIAARMWGGRGMMAALIILTLAATAIFSNANSSSADQFIWVGSGITVVGFMTFWKWAWSAPARALVGRQQLAPQIEKTVARQTNLRRMKWGQFIWACLMVIIGLSWIATKIDLLGGWYRLIFLAGVLMIGSILWRMWQKWQAEQVQD